MNLPPTPDQYPQNNADDDLRHVLRTALAKPDGTDLDVLRGRVLAQWAMRHPASGPAMVGPVGSLGLGLRSRQFRWVLVALAFGAALAWQGVRMHADASLRDLMEPDVLSMMVMGEL